MVLMTDFFHKSFELYFISLLSGISPHFVSIDDMYLFIYLHTRAKCLSRGLAREEDAGNETLLMSVCDLRLKPGSH